MFDLHFLLRVSTLSLAAQYNVRISASSQNTHPITFNPKTLPPQSHSSLQFYLFWFINEAKAHYKTKAVWNKPAILLNLLHCDNRLDCGPDKRWHGTASLFEEFYYDIRGKKILTFLRQDRDIPCRRDNYKKRKSKALVRSPQGKHKQEQCSMHKRRHIVITGTQSFSKDKDVPLGRSY